MVDYNAVFLSVLITALLFCFAIFRVCVDDDCEPKTRLTETEYRYAREEEEEEDEVVPINENDYPESLRIPPYRGGRVGFENVGPNPTTNIQMPMPFSGSDQNYSALPYPPGPSILPYPPEPIAGSMPYPPTAPYPMERSIGITIPTTIQPSAPQPHNSQTSGPESPPPSYNDLKF